MNKKVLLGGNIYINIYIYWVSHEESDKQRQMGGQLGEGRSRSEYLLRRRSHLNEGKGVVGMNFRQKIQAGEET